MSNVAMLPDGMAMGARLAADTDLVASFQADWDAFDKVAQERYGLPDASGRLLLCMYWLIKAGQS